MDRRLVDTISNRIELKLSEVEDVSVAHASSRMEIRGKPQKGQSKRRTERHHLRTDENLSPKKSRQFQIEIPLVIKH